MSGPCTSCSPAVVLPYLASSRSASRPTCRRRGWTSSSAVSTPPPTPPPTPLARPAVNSSMWPVGSARSAEPRLAATAAELPAGHREAFVWQFWDREGFQLTTPLEAFRVTCTPEDLLAQRQGPDRAVRDSGGMYHLMGGTRSFCLGDYNRSDWCTGQARGSADFTLDVLS